MTELVSHVHETIAEVNRNQWNNLVQQSDHGTVFHRYGWLQAIEDGLGRPVYHAVVSKNGNPVAVLPNSVDVIDVRDLYPPLGTAVERLPIERLVSTDPGYGGPLIQSNTDECLDALFGTLENALDRRILSFDMKICDTGQMRYSKYLAKRGFSPTLLSCRFVVDLENGLDGIEQEMHRTRHRELRRGRENDIDVEARTLDQVSVPEIYRDYRRNMQRIDGTVYPRPFFTALAEQFPERTMTFTATRDGEVIGRYLQLLDEEQSSLRYFFSAIGEKSSHEYNVSAVLHARAMQWGIEQGYSTYDFGATGADYADGLFKYKEKYGGEIVPILRWQRGMSPLGWPLYKLGRRAYQKIGY
jgi:predicted N-acyltransferase